VGVPLMVVTTAVLAVKAARRARHHPWRQAFTLADETTVIPDR